MLSKAESPHRRRLWQPEVRIAHPQGRELDGTSAIPLMLGASPHHALAPKFTLKPVLPEIGASCPTPSLFLLDPAWDSGPELDVSIGRARAVLGIDS